MLTALPGPKSRELLKVREENVPQGVSMNVPAFVARGRGALVEDVDGNVLIDFAGGIGVMNIGYSHPEVVAAVKEQAELFFHTSVNVLQYEPYVRLAERLNAIVPCRGERRRTMFVNSGAEAVENAVKVARKFTRKTDVIAFEGAFHGRTLLTMALTSKIKPYKYGFGPLAPGVHRFPYAYCYRCAYGLERASCGLQCLKRLEEAFVGVVDPDDVAAVLVEPVQGEGGFVVPPAEFLAGLRALCDKHDIMLIADEVQTGFCRTGKMFALEHSGVAADIVTTAKSLGAGLPLAAVTARDEVMQASHVGGIGGTYGGNPVACAAALKVVEIMRRDGFAAKAAHIGEVLTARLRALQDECPLVGDVRGVGAMVAMELVKDRATKAPAKEETAAVVREAYQNGLVLLSAGVYGNIVRVLVPLVITDGQLAAAADILTAAVRKAAGAK